MKRVKKSTMISSGQAGTKALVFCLASAIALVTMPRNATAQYIGPSSAQPQPDVPTEKKTASPLSTALTGQPVFGNLPVLTEQTIHQLKMDLERSRTRLERIRSLNKAGHASQDAIEQAEEEVSQKELELASADTAIAKARSLAAFRHPVDMEAKEATVQQVVATLSKACGIPVKVDPSVPANLRLTVEAHGVPFATVLESIASQANLMIAPPEDGTIGVVIGTWPQLNVNGLKIKYVGPHAPWSNDWDVSPIDPKFLGMTTQFAPQYDGMGTPFGGGTFVLPHSHGAEGGGGLNFNGAMGSTSDIPFLGGGINISGEKPGNAPSAATVTQLGNKGIVVSEPGVGPKGEAGLWLTMYWLNGTQLDRGASLFHAFRMGASGRRVSGASGFRTVPKDRSSDTRKDYRLAKPPELDDGLPQPTLILPPTTKETPAPTRR